jgi:methylated-DNA-[protein]-cysteine S-methyltransferase
MTINATTLATPVGELTLLARDDTLVAAGFTTVEALAVRLATPAEEFVHRRDLGRLSGAVSAYLAGDPDALDDLPVSQPGGDFVQAAWKVMREVPAGTTISYAELAARAGRPQAIRAAGSACARNLVAPIVPCHRIVRTDGSLGGYYYGLATKRWLLDHERCRAHSSVQE